MNGRTRDHILNTIDRIGGALFPLPPASRRCCLFLTVFLLVAVLVAGCAVKPTPVLKIGGPEARVYPGESADGLWARSEGLVDGNQQREAIAVLSQLVADHPEHYLAPSALMKIGALHLALSDPDQARAAFSLLVSQYPDSFLVTDARVQILVTHYEQGAYEALTTDANRLLAEPIADSYRLTILGLLGDTYLALDDTTTAGRAYAEGTALATGSAEAVFSEKLTQVIAMMSPDQFDAFRDMFPEASPAWIVVDRMGKSLLYTRTAIGCVLPLSGRYEAIGQQALEGIELALSRFLTEFPDSDIQLMVRDSQGKPDVAARMVSELAQQGAAAIVGPLVTAAEGAAAAQHERVPIVVLTQKQDVTATGDFVFRNFLTPDVQSASLVAFARDHLQGDRFAVIYPDEPYGVLFLNRFWEAVAAAGGQVVGAETYQVDQTDFAKIIKRLAGLAPVVPDVYLQAPKDVAATLAERDSASTSKRLPLPGQGIIGLYRGLPGHFKSAKKAAPPQRPGPVRRIEDADKTKADAITIADFDAVFIPDAPSKAGLIVPQLAYYDIVEPVLFGTNLWHSQDLIKMSRDYVQGAVFPDGFYAQSQRPQVQRFVRAFGAIYDRSPGFIEAICYDTAKLLMMLVARDDIRSRVQLRDALMAVSDFQGVTGTTAFDHLGEAHKDPFMLTVSQSRIMEAASAPERPALDDSGLERP